MRGWNYDGAALSAIGKISFWAFATPRWGARVSGGDADGDGYDEIVATPGPGGGAAFPARFLGFDYDALAIVAAPGFDASPIAGASYGGRMGLGDLDADMRDELAFASGADPTVDSTVKGLSYDGAALSSLLGSFTPFGVAAYGSTVAVGDLGY